MRSDNMQAALKAQKRKIVLKRDYRAEQGTGFKCVSAEHTKILSIDDHVTQFDLDHLRNFTSLEIIVLADKMCDCCDEVVVQHEQELCHKCASDENTMINAVEKTKHQRLVDQEVSRYLSAQETSAGNITYHEIITLADDLSASFKQQVTNRQIMNSLDELYHS
jgi:hypothetical protein